MNDFQYDPEARTQAEVLFDQALDLYDQERYSDCLVLIDQALCLDRGNAYLYFTRGNIRSALHNYRGAAADYIWALRRAPYFCEAMNNLGITYHVLKMYKSSLTLYDRAAPLDPENGLIPYNRANTLAAIGMLGEAVETYSTSIEFLPDFAGSYLNRGHTLSRLGRHHEALADYQRAFALEPKDSNIVWTMIWTQFGKDGLTDDDVQKLEGGSRLDPLHYTSQLCLGVAALKSSDTDAALKCFEQAYHLEPEEWDPHFWIGMVAAMQGETELARHALEQAVDMGLPPLLLTPLYWLQQTSLDFFMLHVDALLQHVGFNA